MSPTNMMLTALLLSLVTACASTPSEPAGPTAEQRAALEAEFAAQQRQEEAAARQKAEDEARAEAARVAEIAARATKAAEELARQEAATKRPAAGQSTAGAARSGSTTNGNVQQRADAVAKQQARIAELRDKIAATKAETTRLESANASLREAIAAAEALSATLTAEQEKYGATDPATGATTQPLAKSRIEELAAEVERLRAQADALAKQTP